MSITFNTRNARESEKYSRKRILECLDEIDIFHRYVGNVKLRQAFCSPLRNDDNPSFSLFQTKDGNILFKDHATGDSGDVFKFLKLLWNCSTTEVYKKIINDFPKEQLVLKSKSRTIFHDEEVEIGIKRRWFDQVDACYWGKYCINKQTLYKFKVYPISYYVISGIKRDESTLEDPMYAYKVNDKFKIYKPLTKNKSKKWRGNLGRNNIFGYEQLPKKGDLLIITKSLKDVMVLYELGYTSIAPSSESTGISEECIKELSSRFKRIVLFFDNDLAGEKHSDKYVNKYGFQKILIDPSEGIKDISDFVDANNLESAGLYMKKLLDGKENEGQRC